jgi:Transposase DDE domain
VLKGESVKAAEKLVSLFEAHTSIIRRGKAGKETEYGHKVWLGETEGAIISGYRVVEGNPADRDQLVPALEHHEQRFGRPPRLVAADRGVYSPDNEGECRKRGIERVCLPMRGKKSQRRREHERQGWFRRGMRFRAGIEGRISVSKRRRSVLLLGRGVLRGMYLRAVQRRQPPTPSQRWNVSARLPGRHQDRRRGAGPLRLQRLRPGLPSRSAADSSQRNPPERGRMLPLAR